MLGLIQNNDQEKLIIKSMFLISAFSKDFPPVRDEIVKLDGIERIVKSLIPKSEFDARLEQSLSALASLVETDDSIQRCRNHQINLREKLNKIISMGSEKSDECKVSSKFIFGHAFHVFILFLNLRDLRSSLNSAK
jgi:hypothetical protein